MIGKFLYNICLIGECYNAATVLSSLRLNNSLHGIFCMSDLRTHHTSRNIHSKYNICILFRSLCFVIINFISPHVIPSLFINHHICTKMCGRIPYRVIFSINNGLFIINHIVLVFLIVPHNCQIFFLGRPQFGYIIGKCNSGLIKFSLCRNTYGNTYQTHQFTGQCIFPEYILDLCMIVNITSHLHIYLYSGHCTTIIIIRWNFRCESLLDLFLTITYSIIIRILFQGIKSKNNFVTIRQSITVGIFF